MELLLLHVLDSSVGTLYDCGSDCKVTIQDCVVQTFCVVHCNTRYLSTRFPMWSNGYWRGEGSVICGVMKEDVGVNS